MDEIPTLHTNIGSSQLCALFNSEDVRCKNDSVSGTRAKHMWAAYRFNLISFFQKFDYLFY